MTAILLQNNAGSVPVYLETSACTAAAGLVSTDVTASLKKATSTSFASKSLAPIVAATAAIGSGANGTVTVAVPGEAGNTYTVEVTVPAGTSPLTFSFAGTAIGVHLAVNSGVPDNTQNTATLVAAGLNALSPGVISATASGTGASPLTVAAGPTALTGGSDGDFIDLGSGWYQVNLSASDTSVTGQLLLRIAGPSIKTSITSCYVSAAVPAPTVTTLTVPTTVIYGYLYNTDGTPVVNAAINAKCLAAPAIMHPGQEGLAVNSDLITTKSDSTGYFTLSLLTGAQVEVFIPVSNYRRVISVPSTSENLFDIP